MNFKEHSARAWRPARDDVPTVEEIQAGCLQRIADAVELMAKRYTELLDERDRATRSRDHWKQVFEVSERRRNALRGVITKLKGARHAK